MRILKLASTPVLLVAAMSDGVAHHGTATFDGDTVVTLEGIVRESRWTNPHSFITIDVPQPDGSSRAVIVEADGPSLLRPLGVTRESIAVGDRVLVYASPSRLAGNDEYLAREVIKEDGSVVALSVRYAREIASGGLPAATSVIGAWVPERTALFSFVPWRATWPLTAAGQEAFARYDIAASFAHAECVPATAPTVMVYPTAKVLEDRGDHLLLNADWMGATRTIYMDGRGHPADDERSLQGHSIGHWDGATLVIDTTNFTPNPIGNAFGVPSGLDKHIVERLSVSGDGSSLRYEFELSDPQYLVAPVGNSFVWHYRPDVSASTVPCDLEAASRYLEPGGD